MAKKKRTVNGSEVTGGSAVLKCSHSERESSMPVPLGSVDLQLPAGKPDLEALRSVSREWLVPRLVEKFLRLHGVDFKHSQNFGNVANRLQLSLPDRLLVAADQARSGTSIGAAGDLSKKFDRRRTRKRNTEC